MTYIKNQDVIQTAELIREACTKEFVRAYEEAGIKGLCEDGRIEYAVDAVRSLDLQKIIITIQSEQNNT